MIAKKTIDGTTSGPKRNNSPITVSTSPRYVNVRIMTKS